MTTEYRLECLGCGMSWPVSNPLDAARLFRTHLCPNATPDGAA